MKIMMTAALALTLFALALDVHAEVGAQDLRVLDPVVAQAAEGR